MNQTNKDIDALYKKCEILKSSKDLAKIDIGVGKLNNSLKSDKTILNRGSVFNYTACGASSVGLDWLRNNGYRF